MICERPHGLIAGLKGGGNLDTYWASCQTCVYGNSVYVSALFWVAVAATSDTVWHWQGGVIMVLALDCYSPPFVGMLGVGA